MSTAPADLQSTQWQGKTFFGLSRRFSTVLTGASVLPKREQTAIEAAFTPKLPHSTARLSLQSPSKVEPRPQTRLAPKAAHNLMASPASAELEGLLHEVREQMHVEVKSWLDFKSNDHKALFAKAVIALGNHGGGYVILGFERKDEGYVEAPGRPSSFRVYNDDEVNGIVRSYASPSFHCSSHVVQSPGGLSFPIVVVPGGHRVPVQAIRGSPDQKTLLNGRIYIRRPGPESAEPGTPEEWRDIMNRCLRANRDDFLDAARAIFSLPPTSNPKPPTLATLRAWAEEGTVRWNELCAVADQKPLGHFRFAYQIEGEFVPPSLPLLLEAIERAAVRHTGWPEWIVVRRETIAPYPIGGILECFLAIEDPAKIANDPAHADFWRAAPEAKLLLIRGYQEDGPNSRFKPGSAFDLTLPVWRIGECLLHAKRLSEELRVENAHVTLTVRYDGLAGRELVAWEGRRILTAGRKVRQQDAIELSSSIEVAVIEDSLPEIVRQLLLPLYGLFDFFVPSESLFVEEIQRLRSNQF